MELFEAIQNVNKIVNDPAMFGFRDDELESLKTVLRAAVQWHTYTSQKIFN